MKRINLKKVALMGLAGGALFVQSDIQAALAPVDVKSTSSVEASDMSKPVTTEQELMSSLNNEGKATYQGLDTEGKAMALKLASQSCKGTNSCKGMNSCKSATNSCAGQGGCKGTSQGPFKDKNKAVEVAKSMSDKRAIMMKH